MGSAGAVQSCLMTPVRHNIVRCEADQTKPLAYLTCAPRTKVRIGGYVAAGFFIALILIAGAVWMLVGPGIMRGPR